MWCTARPPASMLRATVAAEGEASRLGQATSAVAAVGTVGREEGGQSVDAIPGALAAEGRDGVAQKNTGDVLLSPSLFGIVTRMRGLVTSATRRPLPWRSG